jgi:staphylococcal nuclease domain-containing protein 1
VEFKERSGRHHVTLIDQTSGEDVGAMMLRNGLAKLEKRRQDQAGLKDHQEAARQARLGIWAYGDAVDSDEEDSRMAQDVANAKVKLAAGKGRG